MHLDLDINLLCKAYAIKLEICLPFEPCPSHSTYIPCEKKIES